MPKNKRVYLRVTSNQYELMLNNAQKAGYITLSGYLRSVGLRKELLFQQRFNAMYQKIMAGEEQLPPVEEPEIT